MQKSESTNRKITRLQSMRSGKLFTINCKKSLMQEPKLSYPNCLLEILPRSISRIEGSSARAECLIKISRESPNPREHLCKQLSTEQTLIVLERVLLLKKYKLELKGSFFFEKKLKKYNLMYFFYSENVINCIVIVIIIMLISFFYL